MSEPGMEFHEALETYGTFTMGQVPSACRSECPVMQDMIPKEYTSPELSDRLNSFRIAVTALAAQELQAAGSIDQIKDEVVATIDGRLGFEDLSEELLDRAFTCAKVVATGGCRLLDITVRSVGNMPAYSLNNATVELYKSVHPPKEEPVDYYATDNMTVNVDEEGVKLGRKVELPKMTGKELADFITSRLRRFKR